MRPRSIGRAVIALVGVFAAMGAFSANAARLYIDPPAGTYQPGQDFEAVVRIDTQKTCINAAQISLSYPANLIVAEDFKQADSIFPLWVNAGTINAQYGTVTFTGGIPGGYCGKVSGDTGQTNVLGTIIFEVPTSTARAGGLTSANINFLPDTTVFLDDGLGTSAKLMTQGASYGITKTATTTPSLWAAELAKDTTPPEPFMVGLFRDPSLFSGNYFITFSTIDKQTGVSYYEVIEKDTKGNTPGTNTAAVWQKAVSPYQLIDQSLSSTVIVRATDKAGNVRQEVLFPQAQGHTMSIAQALLYLFFSSSFAIVFLTIARFLMTL